MDDVFTTQQPALPARTRPASKGDTAHVDWGTIGAAKRRLGELRGEPWHAAARTRGRTLSPTLTRADSEVKRRSHTLRLGYSIEAAGKNRSPLDQVDADSLDASLTRRWTCGTGRTRVRGLVPTPTWAGSEMRALPYTSRCISNLKPTKELLSGRQRLAMSIEASEA